MPETKASSVRVQNIPNIESSDVAAARRFLTDGRDEGQSRPGRALRNDRPISTPAVRHGITRARNRSVAKPKGG